MEKNHETCVFYNIAVVQPRRKPKQRRSVRASTRDEFRQHSLTIISPVLTPNTFLFLSFLNKFLLSDRQLFDHGYPVGGDLLDFAFFYCVNPWSKLTPQIDLFNPNPFRTCSRCSSNFTPTSPPTPSSSCLHHWGRLSFNPDFRTKFYACCNSPVGSPGCTVSPQHVWTGTTEGINGPYPGFVATSSNPQNATVYAVDCEMSYTAAGLEATRVTVVGPNGQCVYDRFIRPANLVTDYNTRYSGITEEDLVGASSLQEVQKELLEFISSETILVGHGMENDLRALKMVHGNVVDTAVVFPHERGFPYRKSLKVVVKEILEKDIQTGENGHDSEEDAREAMALMVSLFLR